MSTTWGEVHESPRVRTQGVQQDFRFNSAGTNTEGGCNVTSHPVTSTIAEKCVCWVTAPPPPPPTPVYAIALPIVAGLVVLAALIALVVYCKRKKAAASATAQPTAVEITMTAPPQLPATLSSSVVVGMPMSATDAPAGQHWMDQQPSSNHGQWTESVVIDEIRSLFRSLDTDGNRSLDLAEFVAGAASLGLPPTSDPVKAFELLDVDGSGELSLDEICLAIGPDLLAAKQQGVTATACLANVIANLHAPVKDEAASAAPATAGEAPPALTIATPVGSRPAAGPEERNVTCGDYFAALLPCYLCCCSTYGGAVANKTLQGSS